MVNEHEGATDNYCQISVEYVSDAVEISRRKQDANAGNPNVVKILEYGDNIENADLVNSYETLEGLLFTPSCTILRTVGAAAAPMTGGEN